MKKNFAVIGVGGYIAPRHLKAIRDTNNFLIAATDPNDSVGVLDQFSYDVKFFTEFERFDRHLEKLRFEESDDKIDYVTICSPNHLHDAHCRFALRIGANAICEKPLVISPWNLDVLEKQESETDKKIFTILQLRLHPKLIALKEKIDSNQGRFYNVSLTYITSRGPWYHTSWKGSDEKSGGIAVNIGIHFFDLLIWLFGAAQSCLVHYSDGERMGGILELKRAHVKWFLSINKMDLPYDILPGGKSTYRSIAIDEDEIEFTDGFTDLHTKVYSETLAGRGFGISDARPSIELVHKLRYSKFSDHIADDIHPFLKKHRGV